MNNHQNRSTLLLCFIIFISMIFFAENAPVFCQTSENWTIHPQVTDSGGGTCGSDNFRLCFSLGQASPVGMSDGNTKSLSAGFISGAAQQVQAGESSEASSSDSSSGSSGTCFIRSICLD